MEDITDSFNLDDSMSESDADWSSGDESSDQEGDRTPPLRGLLSGTNNAAADRNDADGVTMMGYGDHDEGPEAPIPPFRPANPPGLLLPESRTRGDYGDFCTPGAFFKLYFTTTLMDMLCGFTNTYYRQQAENKPFQAKYWTDITPDEMYTFFALLMYMSLVQVSRVELYWSTQLLFHGLWGRAFMTRFRYKQIQTFLKVSDPCTENREDKITKVRMLTEYIRRKCMKLWQPHEYISIDERMVANKGRYSFRQYIKDKPTKWGMKLWVLADSITGYTYNFDVYLGKRENTGFGLGYTVVMNLCQCLFRQGYKLFVDNFYTSVKLFIDLVKEGIVACGTIIANRKGFPKELKDVKNFNKVSNRGSMRCIRRGNVGFIQWKDNKVVNIITTMHHNLTRRLFCQRRTKVNGQFRPAEVSQPLAIRDYNKFMGGVDRSDQMISKYKALRRTTKFWKTLMYHMLDVAKVNSFILFQEFRKLPQNSDRPELNRPNNYSQLDFTLELIKELANIDENMPVPLYKKMLKLDTSPDNHVVVPVHSSVRGNCHRCWRLEKKERKSNFKCRMCEKSFCFNKDRNCLLSDHPMTDQQ